MKWLPWLRCVLWYRKHDLKPIYSFPFPPAIIAQCKRCGKIMPLGG